MITVNLTFETLSPSDECQPGALGVQNLPLTFDRLISKMCEFAHAEMPGSVSSEPYVNPQTGVIMVRGMHRVAESTEGLWDKAVEIVLKRKTS